MTTSDEQIVELVARVLCWRRDKAVHDEFGTLLKYGCPSDLDCQEQQQCCERQHLLRVSNSWQNARAALQALKANGYAVLPVEPDAFMQMAAENFLDEAYAAHPDWNDAKDVIEELHADDLYRAMIKAHLK